MYTHQIAIKQATNFPAVAVITDRHVAHSVDMQRDLADYRFMYKQACAISRLMSQGYSEGIALMIYAGMQHRVYAAALPDNNPLRQTIDRFMVRKLADRRATERAALHIQLVDVIDEWRDWHYHVKPSYAEACRALHIAATYGAGKGQNPAVYQKFIARVQAAIDALQAEQDLADYRAEKRTMSDYRDAITSDNVDEMPF